MAIADVYDAPSAEGVVRMPSSIRGQCALSATARGMHFDPDVVDAFLARENDVIRIAGDVNYT